eukprot:9484772-Pyramimonas_sp.AAC.1
MAPGDPEGECELRFRALPPHMAPRPLQTILRRPQEAQETAKTHARTPPRGSTTKLPDVIYSSTRGPREASHDTLRFIQTILTQSPGAQASWAEGHSMTSTIVATLIAF